MFQFDFLNDDFSKLPKALQNIINHPEKRKKLVIYINPPYAEASSYGDESKPLVANSTKVFNDYKSTVGADALNELFAQFFIRVSKEIPNSILAAFSKPKYITSDKYKKFRNVFLVEFESGFVCNSETFDNVKGKFPITFIIWKLNNVKQTNNIKVDVFGMDNNLSNSILIGKKKFYYPTKSTIGNWRSSFYLHGNNPIAYMIIVGPSMQSNNNTFFTNKPAESYIKKSMVAQIEQGNLIEMCVYLAVRQSVETTWLNDKDVYLFPNKKWKKDKEFQQDCLAFALFDNSNNVSSKFGINHWIPFAANEVNAKTGFESDFMSKFIKGKIKPEPKIDMFSVLMEPVVHYESPLKFSVEATQVFNAGRELWIYYHQQPNCNVNASLYDIREHFQGRNDAGKMNNKSNDETYTKLIAELRENIKLLAKKIEPKVYEYEFLKE